MIKRADEMKTDIRSKMRGGSGEAHFTYLMDANEVPHARLFSTITLEPGSSIGEHTHTGEIEYYWILQGEGIVTERDGEKIVKKGDLVITGGGESHAIRNEGSEPLRFLALIILE
ncbi:MAG TPA: cupin domain-containing protein [Sphaerochaeta sp.]|jgi:mannose-6-phosphate isomerase-like protein (cupin superfamily)|nr:cupin domain-containing protein [Spirochaetales bacterium]HPX29267.1 cupin domain-containing protein [Sphaerochaeta sp.]HQB54324.1 cupin domain-containing protein [Sphaerochaeta sp.]